MRHEEMCLKKMALCGRRVARKRKKSARTRGVNLCVKEYERCMKGKRR